MELKQVAGGTRKLALRGSVTYRNEQGVVQNTGLTIGSGRLTVDSKPSDKFDITASIAYTYRKNDKAFRGAAGFLQNLLLWPLDVPDNSD
jgi:autotransporter translocation and assembly factor TamB